MLTKVWSSHRQRLRCLSTAAVEPTLDFQGTLRKAFTMTGVGLHSGKEASIRVEPAEAGSGISFKAGGHDEAPIHYAHVNNDIPLCTAIQTCHAQYRTVEHLLAALHMCGIDCATVSFSGELEVPILDGSAIDFMNAINDAGKVTHSLPREYVRVQEQVKIEDEGRMCMLLPLGDDESSDPNRLELDVSIEYEHPLIRQQQATFTLSRRGHWESDAGLQVARARTFAMENDIEAMRRHGLAKGGSLDNAVVYGNNGDVLNESGLRSPNEAVLHKILDAVGDLSLLPASRRLVGRFVGVKCGHALNNRILRKLFSSEANYKIDTGVPA